MIRAEKLQNYTALLFTILSIFLKPLNFRNSKNFHYVNVHKKKEGRK